MVADSEVVGVLGVEERVLGRTQLDKFCLAIE